MDAGYSNAVWAELQRREQVGYPTLRWYKCHGCGREYPLSAGVRLGWGCNNPKCSDPCIHIHSDLDGEQPTQLEST